MRILLVEDERELSRQIVNEVKRAGFAVDCANSISEAIGAIDAYAYELILLDRRLPDGDAIRLVPELRRKQPDMRVLMLTALDDLNERVRGLDAGADDYLTKPCHPAELMARIRASLRRPGGTALPPVIVGEMSFDLCARAVSIHGAPVSFHQREFALLESLARRAGQFVRRSTLMNEIYGFDDEVQPPALTMLVSRVRARLIEYKAGVDIRSVRGVGCMLTEKR